MIPGTHNFSTRRGDFIRREFRVKERGTDTYMDFTDYTGRSQIRDVENVNLVGTFDVVIADVEIDIEGVPTEVSHVQIYLSGDDSAALPVGRLPYDVELVDASGDPSTWIAGFIDVSADVTRD